MTKATSLPLNVKVEFKAALVLRTISRSYYISQIQESPCVPSIASVVSDSLRPHGL